MHPSKGGRFLDMKVLLTLLHLLLLQLILVVSVLAAMLMLHMEVATAPAVSNYDHSMANFPVTGIGSISTFDR